MSSHLYGPAVTSAIRSLRAEPRLPDICRAMRKGILAHEWTREPAVADFLGTVKPRKQDEAAWRVLSAARERMEREQAQIRERYLAVVASTAYAALPAVARRLYKVLYCLSGDPEVGGPNILASVRVLLVTLDHAYNRRYDPKSVTYAWHCLARAGILTVTPGVSHQGFSKARTTVYHLLPGLPDDPYSTSPAATAGLGACGVEPPGGPSGTVIAAVQRWFREAIELLRRLWNRVRHTGGCIEWQDLFPDGRRRAAL